MAYFEDLSPDSNHPADIIRWAVMPYGHTTINQSVTVGWLAPQHRCSKGRTPEQFRERLRALCATPCLRHMGFFSCKMGLCKLVPGWPPGIGEIIVPSRSRVYVAPSLIYHYVSWHRYRPPQEFIDAVVELPNH